MATERPSHEEREVQCRCGVRYCRECTQSCPDCQGVHTVPIPHNLSFKPCYLPPDEGQRDGLQELIRYRVPATALLLVGLVLGVLGTMAGFDAMYDPEPPAAVVQVVEKQKP